MFELTKQDDMQKIREYWVSSYPDTILALTVIRQRVGVALAEKADRRGQDTIKRKISGVIVNKKQAAANGKAMRAALMQFERDQKLLEAEKAKKELAEKARNKRGKT